MADRIRIHLDENIDPVIASALRCYGVDVTTTAEANLRGSNDEAQLAFAKRHMRVIVTHDEDFLRMATFLTHCIRGLLIAIYKRAR